LQQHSDGVAVSHCRPAKEAVKAAKQPAKAGKAEQEAQPKASRGLFALFRRGRKAAAATTETPSRWA